MVEALWIIREWVEQRLPEPLYDFVRGDIGDSWVGWALVGIIGYLLLLLLAVLVGASMAMVR